MWWESERELRGNSIGFVFVSLDINEGRDWRDEFEGESLLVRYFCCSRFNRLVIKLNIHNSLFTEYNNKQRNIS